MAKFKEGQRVEIVSLKMYETRNSPLYTQNKANPLGVEGTVTAVYGSSYTVEWDNGTINSYNDWNLKLVSEEKPKKSEKSEKSEKNATGNYKPYAYQTCPEARKVKGLGLPARYMGKTLILTSRQRTEGGATAVQIAKWADRVKDKLDLDEIYIEFPYGVDSGMVAYFAQSVKMANRLTTVNVKFYKSKQDQ